MIRNKFKLSFPLFAPNTGLKQDMIVISVVNIDYISKVLHIKILLRISEK